MNEKNKLTGFVELEEMEFYAYHGCETEERKTGNQFFVNISYETEIYDAVIADDVHSTVDYVKIYNLVKGEIVQTRNLIETVACHILEKIKSEFPQISHANVKISKANPPIGGIMKRFSVKVGY